ncbi:hypothetical protein, partial [Xanthomonas hortorum]|uniref:hypothetical protein n=1 Tax=Xanthomonas hortorum TaxID=56454 RepID=UPI001B875AFE
RAPVTRGFPTESARNGQTPKIQTRLSATTRHSALSGRVIQTFPNIFDEFFDFHSGTLYMLARGV